MAAISYDAPVPVEPAPAPVHTRSALELLAAARSTDEHGYVQLQTIPYRGHHLLAQAVLDVTRPGDRVFEGGVSSGYFAAVLADAGLRVDGHELDPAAAAEARRVCEEVYVGDLDAFDATTLPHDYEVLLFGDTLEHLPDPAAVLARLRTRLSPGGHLVLSIPNVANWAMRVGLLAGHFDYTDRGILDRTHLRFYTRRTLVEMLGQAGFEVTRLRATVPVPALRSPGPARLAHRVGNAWPSLFAYTFVVTARVAGRS